MCPDGKGKEVGRGGQGLGLAEWGAGENDPEDPSRAGVHVSEPSEKPQNVDFLFWSWGLNTVLALRGFTIWLGTGEEVLQYLQE